MKKDSISIWDSNPENIINKRIQKFKRAFACNGKKILKMKGNGLLEGGFSFSAREESLREQNTHKTINIKYDPYFDLSCEYIFVKIYQFYLFEKIEASALTIIDQALKSLIQGRMVVLLEERKGKVGKYYAIEIPLQNKYITIISDTLNFDEDELFLNNFQNVLKKYFNLDIESDDIKNNVIETLNYLKLSYY